MNDEAKYKIALGFGANAIALTWAEFYLFGAIALFLPIGFFQWGLYGEDED